VKLPRKLTSLLGPALGRGYLAFVCRTTKIEYRGFEHLEKFEAEGQNALFAFWHGRLALLAALRREKPVYLMISRHGDGEIIARIAEAFNKPSVRGSTTRGGGSAFRQLARLLRSGHSGGVTPDGPRGPRRQCQMGVIALAKLTGCPILPAAYSVRQGKFLHSWDRFLFPYPFNRAVVFMAPPIKIEPDCDKSAMEAKRLELERALNTLTDEADRAMGRPEGEP